MAGKRKFFVNLQAIKTCKQMEYQKISNEPRRSLIINNVESGMPRWLIEVGFVMMAIQAVSTAYDVSSWIETNGMVIPRAVVFLLGDIILYYAMMRGMKPLRHPYTWMWWLLIVLNVIGDITYILPESILNLAVAVAQPLAYLPLGISIGCFYRGRLQWVGILMVAFMVTMIILPIMLNDFIPYIITDALGTITLIALAWTMRKLLI